MSESQEGREGNLLGGWQVLPETERWDEKKSRPHLPGGGALTAVRILVLLRCRPFVLLPASSPA